MKIIKKIMFFYELKKIIKEKNINILLLKELFDKSFYNNLLLQEKINLLNKYLSKLKYKEQEKKNIIEELKKSIIYLNKN